MKRFKKIRLKNTFKEKICSNCSSNRCSNHIQVKESKSKHTATVYKVKCLDYEKKIME